MDIIWIFYYFVVESKIQKQRILEALTLLLCRIRLCFIFTVILMEIYLCMDSRDKQFSASHLREKEKKTIRARFFADK